MVYRNFVLLKISLKNAVVLLVLLSFPSITYAYVTWPALYAETKINTIPVITIGIVIEFFLIRWLFKLNISNAIKYTLVANIVSGVLGLFLRPASGVMWESSIGQLVMGIFAWSTFNPIAWFSVPVIGGMLNSVLELLTIRFIWKYEFDKKNFYFLWLANSYTLGIATLWVVKLNS